MTEENANNDVHLFQVTVTAKDSKRLLRRLLSEYEKGTLSTGTAVLLRFDRNAVLELTQDLMAVGRILSAVRLLQHELSCEVHVEFVGAKVSPTLLEMGLPRYLAGIGVQILHPRKTQASLFEHDETEDAAETLPVEFQFLAHRSYSKCLIPITLMTIEVERGERSLDDVASRQIAKVEALMRSEVSKLLKEPEGLLSEMAIAISPAVRELVGNAVQHSCSPAFIIAATLSRTLGFTAEVGARRKIDVPYSPIFQFLVADFGVGIVRSVHKTLCAHQDPMAKSVSLGDFRKAKNAEHYSIESALIQSLFNGTLAIRRGRTSEGLRDVQRSLEWCNGHLEFRSGQSEANVRPSAYVGRPTVAIETTADGWNLGGVVARIVAPSRKLLALELDQIAKGVSPKPHTVSRSLDIERFELSSGMLGASPTPPLQRRSEIDSEEIVGRLRHLSQTGDEKFLALDFRRSNIADIDYLDALIQEIAKRAHDTEGSSAVLTGRLAITSLPRSMIFALRRRNCQALLMSQCAPLLVLDDADQPHFLGVPRFRKGALDVEEALWITQLVGHIDIMELKLKGFAPETIEWLIAMAKQLDSPLLRLAQEKDVIALERVNLWRWRNQLHDCIR